MSNPFLDENGEKVVHFAADVRTLGKIGELADKITEMAESGAWRRYRTAVGTDTWRECEFDYFLIACDLEHDDVYRAIKWHKLGDKTRASMDENAELRKRRPLEQAAAKWHAPTPETLDERAARLGWIKSNGSVRSALSERQRRKQMEGRPERWVFKIERRIETVDEQAQAIVDKLGEDPALRERVRQMLRAESVRTRRHATTVDKPKTGKSDASRLGGKRR
jgi:hypothetical protein